MVIHEMRNPANAIEMGLEQILSILKLNLDEVMKYS